MAKDQIKTGKNPFIQVGSCGGELVIRGWSEPNMRIKGDYQLEESEKGFRLSSSGSLLLNVPEGALLSTGRVEGDLIVKQVIGSGSFEDIHGDAVFSGVAQIDVGVVHGDLVMRKVKGTLTVHEVRGDVSARGIETAVLRAIHGDLSVRRGDGNLEVGQIDGDADIRDIDGDVIIEQSLRDVNLFAIKGQINIAGVSGDIRIRGGLGSGDHVLEAKGDIVVRWPVGMPLNLVASGGRIDNHLPLEDMNEKSGSLIGHIGQGSTSLSLTTPGRIILKESEPTGQNWDSFGGEMEFDFGFDMAAIATKIEAEVNKHLSRATRDMEAKFGTDFGQGIAEKVAGKMEKAAERARRRTEQRGRSTGFDFTPVSSVEPKKSASSEEQLKILKMVENGKISPEEAGMLLEALDT